MKINQQEAKLFVNWIEAVYFELSSWGGKEDVELLKKLFKSFPELKSLKRYIWVEFEKFLKDE